MTVDVETQVEHGYVDSDGVKIHYAAMGEGPLLLMVHGFPDFWYSWRHQMAGLCDRYRCVAIDQRGYNLSDKPKGVENYKLKKMTGDVIATIGHFGEKTAIYCGHDWGGAVGWRTALSKPQYFEKLIILNLPHPQGMAHELATNPEQQKASEYARKFQQEGGHKSLNAESLADWVTDPEAKSKYIEAFERSDFEAMTNHYKANYMKPPYEELPELPKIQMPVLQFHGLDDHALLPGGLNNTWHWMQKDYTLITVPGSGHFVQQDAAELVTRSIRMWLSRDE